MQYKQGFDNKYYRDKRIQETKNILNQLNLHNIKDNNLFSEKFIKDIIYDDPHISFDLLNLAGNFANKTNFYNARAAAELLKASLDFGKNAYKIQNATVVGNYKETGPLADFVKEKLISQNMDPRITPGIIHNYDSEMSKAIAQSTEIKEFIKKYSKALSQKQLITNVSLKLDSTKSLYWGINYADIIFASYDAEGNITLTILDTYDFNKLEKSIPVNIGYSAQSAKLLTRYFNIFFVKVP